MLAKESAPEEVQEGRDPEDEHNGDEDQTHQAPTQLGE